MDIMGSRTPWEETARRMDSDAGADISGALYKDMDGNIFPYNMATVMLHISR